MTYNNPINKHYFFSLKKPSMINSKKELHLPFNYNLCHFFCFFHFDSVYKLLHGIFFQCGIRLITENNLSVQYMQLINIIHGRNCIPTICRKMMKKKFKCNYSIITERTKEILYNRKEKQLTYKYKYPQIYIFQKVY